MTPCVLAPEDVTGNTTGGINGETRIYVNTSKTWTVPWNNDSTGDCSHFSAALTHGDGNGLSYNSSSRELTLASTSNTAVSLNSRSMS